MVDPLEVGSGLVAQPCSPVLEISELSLPLALFLALPLSVVVVSPRSW